MFKYALPALSVSRYRTRKLLRDNGERTAGPGLFKHGSIVVNVGDTIKSGQYLGLCGNSGHSSEPHLHYHMQNSPTIFEGEGLPIQFESYYSNDLFIEKGEPEYAEFLRRE